MQQLLVATLVSLPFVALSSCFSCRAVPDKVGSMSKYAEWSSCRIVLILEILL
jgi:hypothetical protein